MTPTLTYRQVAVLSMFADGHPEQEIARYLYLTRVEVRRILVDCLSRLGVPTKKQAVARARELELIGTGRVVA